MPGPLADVRILDLTWIIAGPFASMILCDLGAEVIKVERPPHGDPMRRTPPLVGGESALFAAFNRGKRSIILDLQAKDDRDTFLRLVDDVDVVMENFTPGTMESLGLGYDVLAARNPRLVYAATSGFGRTGPLSDRPALDPVIQGMSGMMGVTGEPGGNPVKPGVPLADLTAGLYTVIGILAALHERERSGRGQLVDVAMLDCQTALLQDAFARYFATGREQERLGTGHPEAVPFQAFPTRDGQIVVALGGGVENAWDVFCALIDRCDLIDDPRFETAALRVENRRLLEPTLAAEMRRRTTNEWLSEFEAAGIPCGPVQTVGEAARHPQTLARNMLVDIEDASGRRFKAAASPIKLSRTPASTSAHVPSAGADAEHILTMLLPHPASRGYSDS